MVGDFCLFILRKMIYFFFFFFQAEDGIRDHCVTGVQTCDLPIYSCPRRCVPRKCVRAATAKRDCRIALPRWGYFFSVQNSASASAAPCSCAKTCCRRCPPINDRSAETTRCSPQSAEEILR